MELSVVIPAYNEEKRIGATIDRTLAFLSRYFKDFELIVVDDGSSDQTVNVVKSHIQNNEKRVSIILNGANRGKGYSVKKGMLSAGGTYVLFSDADLSTPIEEATKLINYLKNGYDVAIGSRDLPDSQVVLHQNFLREFMGKAFNKLAKLLTFKDIHDSQCGFKCFKNEAVQKLFKLQKMDGFSFDVEVLYLAQKSGYKIKEVPVIWRNSTASKVNIFKDPIKMFLDLFFIRLSHISDDKS